MRLRWLRRAREEAVREQRRWRMRELAITRVLDDRGAVDDTLAAQDGVSVRTVRETVATARALEDLPEIASVAAQGGLSSDQLTQVVGEPWEPRRRRMADALVELWRNYADVEAVSGPAPHLMVLVPLDGPATVAGVPLPDPMVEALRAEARIEPVLVDHDGTPVAVGRVESVLTDKTKRVVKQRDGKCRRPGCDRRVGLDVHHLWPASWGGKARPCCSATPTTQRLSPIHRDDLPALAELAATRARAGPDAA